jgi:hypothetical protein
VAAADIGKQLRKQIAIIRAIPQVMVRIDDRQLRLDDLLVTLIKPLLSDRGLHRRHARRRGTLGEGASHRQIRGGDDTSSSCQNHTP